MKNVAYDQVLDRFHAGRLLGSAGLTTCVVVEAVAVIVVLVASRVHSGGVLLILCSGNCGGGGCDGDGGGGKGGGVESLRWCLLFVCFLVHDGEDLREVLLCLLIGIDVIFSLDVRVRVAIYADVLLSRMF